MRQEGRITQWKDVEGFGFITPRDGGDRIFVHVRSLNRHQPRPVGNERITYELGKDSRGRIQAHGVAFVGRRQSPATAIALVFVSIFLGLLALATYIDKLPVAVLWWYLGAGAVTFLTYAADKNAARKDRQRTPEKRLHLCSLLGGWPGALLAQRLLRHKSSKKPFLVTFWITVVLNLGGLCWLTLPGNVDMVRAALERLLPDRVLERPRASIEWSR